MKKKYNLSGYTTVRNCVSMGYPFVESIENLINFCDEVIVLDSSDDTDNTQEILNELLKKHNKLKVFHVDVPWSAPNHGIYDGLTKALARSKCTGEFLWQQDVDEITAPDVRDKIDSLISSAEKFMEQTPIICLPVIEYWGSNGKVRIDVNPWKWRISKNLPHITHGIPKQLRKKENGLLYANHGTDGCDYIDKTSDLLIPYSNFVPPNVEQIRQKATTDPKAALEYQNWFNMVSEHLPTVYHFSWYSIKNKIHKYKQFWNKSWLALYNEKRAPGWNPFFSDRSLEDATEDEIDALAKKLEAETGGHIFHKPYKGEKINHIILEREVPKIIENWCKENSNK